MRPGEVQQEILGWRRPSIRGAEVAEHIPPAGHKARSYRAEDAVTPGPSATPKGLGQPDCCYSLKLVAI